MSVGLFDALLQDGGKLPQHSLQPSQCLRNNEFVGPDGVFILLGSVWSQKNMLLEPQEGQGS